MKPLAALAKFVTSPVRGLSRAILGFPKSPKQKAAIERRRAEQAQTNANYAQNQAQADRSDASTDRQIAEVSEALAAYDLQTGQQAEFNASVREQQARYAEGPVLARDSIRR